MIDRLSCLERGDQNSYDWQPPKKVEATESWSSGSGSRCDSISLVASLDLVSRWSEGPAQTRLSHS